MIPYDSMLLRETAAGMVNDPSGFEALLDFTEWTGILAPVLAFERARSFSDKLQDAIENSSNGWFMRDFHECRLALETAVRYQHSSGDALARLLWAAVTDSLPPAELHLSTFNRELAPQFRKCPSVLSARMVHGSSDWSHLSAFCNTLKHMSLIEPEYHVVVGERMGLRFRAFEFKGKAYPPLPHDELQDLCDRVSDGICGVLNVLCEELAGRAQLVNHDRT